MASGKFFFYLCAQVTLRGHPVENQGIARLQTLKIAGERRDMQMFASQYHLHASSTDTNPIPNMVRQFQYHASLIDTSP